MHLIQISITIYLILFSNVNWNYHENTWTVRAVTEILLTSLYCIILHYKQTFDFFLTLHVHWSRDYSLSSTSHILSVKIGFRVKVFCVKMATWASLPNVVCCTQSSPTRLQNLTSYIPNKNPFELSFRPSAT